MRITVEGISEGQPIPGQFAFAVPHAQDHMALSDNRNPRVTWDGVPEGTRSFAVVVVDPDVPSDASNVNQEGKTLAEEMPRVDFYHWLLVDIPAEVREIAEGEDSDGVTPRGKSTGRVEKGVRGANDYTDFMAGDPDMKGVYGGYDGPCPPWNDERLHHYTFTVYALDVTSLGLDGDFRGGDVMKAMEGHILDRASVTGTYTLKANV
ncbi:MAG: YbhB/YbcL family Raf kinase inhibitor-like protein [Alcanivorax sp.]|uniref:YbhB/YbcL family Raf kinase inhibitor-like protein n=1 Tax=Alloalcanivorax marinus TaxID=1177169 RepID=A0A9Q3UP95_9GAMM|nr:YbhB/YbcL family Raf kinase inhibitor-like protein [Alloalcanivorax marinus]MBM7333212.1 YbhB/YbcL family Raf kinase inhibitor-like protein [Alloalcanivorax marinus]MCC4310632.1 YbhB/YbcL family Raf kinase inhibitor-like protein [Alloalcanivorax marinus]MCU5788467.1 PEBP family protein [Alloalcanivorax marinus]